MRFKTFIEAQEPYFKSLTPQRNLPPSVSINRPFPQYLQ